MKHAKDNPSRIVHGVFDADDEHEVLLVLDQAYRLIMKKSGQVNQQNDEDGRTEYTIDMPNRIGFVGGENGARQNNPGTKRLKMILDGNRVITAYPTWPPRR